MEKGIRTQITIGILMMMMAFQWHAHYVYGGVDNVSFWLDVFPVVILSIALIYNTKSK